MEQYKPFIVNYQDENIQKLLKNQEHLCYICSQTFIIGDLDPSQSIIKTCCNHFFHYDCLKMAIQNSKTYQNKRECPYCRKNTGWLPLKNGIPQKYIHKEYYQSSLSKNVFCKAIIKSGKKKGQICGCKVNPSLGKPCCGRHKNYIFEEVSQENNDYFKQNWFIGSILKCYQ